MDKKVAMALARALKTWCAQPSAFTAARNGGAEFVLRNAVLGELEVEFACLGFTEANGMHVDAALALHGAHPLCFEFKHGMLHGQLLSSIERDFKSATRQLLDVQVGARFYVHFVHALECDDPYAGYALQHNTQVFTSYKKFQTRATLQALLPAVTAMLGPVWQEVPIRESRFPDVRATLYCWAFYVSEAGRVPLPLT